MPSVSAIELSIGLAIDLIFGDPRWMPHPVRGIGRMTSRLEPALRRLPERLGGSLLAAIITGAMATAAWATVQLAGPIGTVYWIFACLAIRSLDLESNLVIRALAANDLELARRRLARIVGRDTADLPQSEVTRGVFETVAENLNDAVVAPLFYLGIAGVPGMAAYKAINTLDSMVGYKNEKYLRFGWASARLDDIVNFVPARITAALIVLVAFCLRLRWREAIKAVLRDARLQPSPNAGYPEAALAGALGIRLGGLNFYSGIPSHKPFLGDSIEPLDWRMSGSVRLVLYATSMLSAVLVILWLQ